MSQAYFKIDNTRPFLRLGPKTFGAPSHSLIAILQRLYPHNCVKSTASSAMGFRKNFLRNRDDKVTNASDLTLRQSILPLCLVTILFFLWVRFEQP